MPHPLDLPDPQQAGPEYGVVRVILFAAVYAGIVGWAVWYLLRKLPRAGRGPKDSGQQ